MPHTPGGKHAAWVDRHPPLSHRRTSGTHFRVARAILSGVPLYMRLSKPNTFLEYHIVINSRGGGRPGKNGPHTNYMVKCLVFEISSPGQTRQTWSSFPCLISRSSSLTTNKYHNNCPPNLKSREISDLADNCSDICSTDLNENRTFFIGQRS